MNFSQDQRGVALFLTVLVMGTVAVSVLLGLTRQGINAVAESHEQTNALVARSAAYGCLEEVFLQLVGDSAWSEATVTTPDAVCNVTMVPGGTTDILVTTSWGNVTQGVAANVTLDPFIVNDLEPALSL